MFFVKEKKLPDGAGDRGVVRIIEKHRGGLLDDIGGDVFMDGQIVAFSQDLWHRRETRR